MDSLNNAVVNQSQDPNPDVNLVYLYPDPEKCLGRVPSLSKVDGLELNEIEVLNNWFIDNWKKIYSSGFMMNDSLTRDFTNYLQIKSPILVDLEKAEAYLSVQKLLYNGLRLELEDDNENVSQCKLFHRYYYSCRENPLSLNNLVVLSNVIWSLKKYKRDEFALTCLVDILLQSYMVALTSFISLGGVIVLREILEFLAHNQRLKQSANFLLKCMDLLDKLDINFKVLQTSKIGIPVNCIALGKSHAKLKLDYECSNDKVKLKATNLIKKWKAIRDASLPPKTNSEGDAKFKKINSSESRLVAKKSLEGSMDKSVQEKRINERREGDRLSHSEPNTNNHNEGEGSFVLNIINTMVEQKEKEKKRKMEIRNSQMSSKYKTTINKTKNEKESTSGLLGADGNKGGDRRSMIEKEPEKSKEPIAVEPEKDNSSTTQLASLMNFFKEYSNKTEEKSEETTGMAGGSVSSLPTGNKQLANTSSKKEVKVAPQVGVNMGPLLSGFGGNQHVAVGMSGNVSQHVGAAVVGQVHGTMGVQLVPNVGQKLGTNGMSHPMVPPSAMAAGHQLQSNGLPHQMETEVVTQSQKVHLDTGLAAHQMGVKFAQEQYGYDGKAHPGLDATKLGSHYGSEMVQMAYGDYQNLGPQSNLTHMGTNGSTHMDASLSKQALANKLSQQAPGVAVAQQMTSPLGPPPPPYAGKTASSTSVKPSHTGFTNPMETSADPHGFSNKDYRNRNNEQQTGYSNYQSYGQTGSPSTYGQPPPPPPPPGIPAHRHFANTQHEKKTSSEVTKSRFSGPRTKFHSAPLNYHPQQMGYDENNQEGYMVDKHIDFYRTGAEPPKEDKQSAVVPPWK